MNLNLYDKDLNRIEIIGGRYVSCFWEEGYNTVGSFSLELIETDYYKKNLKSDCYVGRDDRKTLMVIKTVEVYGGKIVASGKQATRVLEDVSFVGTIKKGSNIDTSVKNAYNKSNKYRNVYFSETDLGVQYSKQISNKSFLDLCKTMAQSEDLGFRAVKINGSIFIEFYKPEENKNLVLSERFGNLTIDSFSDSTENFKNYAIVLGQGEGDERKKVVVDLSNGEEKREMIVDARDIYMEENDTEESYSEKLTARGFEKLSEKKKTFSCSFYPYSNDFGKKYDLGDILTIYLTDYGIKLKARVSQFTQKSQNNQVSTTIKVGQITITR